MIDYRGSASLPDAQASRDNLVANGDYVYSKQIQVFVSFLFHFESNWQ